MASIVVIDDFFSDPHYVRQQAFNARMSAVLDKVEGQKNLSPAYWSLQSWKKGFKV